MLAWRTATSARNTGPIVLTGALSAKALMLSVEIARELGMAVYAPAETVFALGCRKTKPAICRPRPCRCNNCSWQSVKKR